MALSQLTSSDAGAAVRNKINPAIAEADKVAGLAAILASLQISLAPYLDLVGGAPDRPGDSRTLFTRQMTGSPKLRPAIDRGTIEDGGTLGQVLRISGADTDPGLGYIDVAPRRAYYMRPARTYLVQHYFQRAQNPSDPLQHAIELRFQNLSSVFGQVSNVRLGNTYAPTIQDGPLFIDTFVGKAGAPGTPSYVVPPTSAYGVPFFRVFGNGHLTDLGLVRLYDVSDALAGGADVASILARVKKLEDGQLAGVTYAVDWNDLKTRLGKVSGAGAETPDSDTGTHVDPVTGSTVPNAGGYSWSESPAGWRWVRPTIAATVAASTGIGVNALKTAVSFYRPADVLGSWTSQVNLPDGAAAQLTEGGQIALVDGADGRALRITPTSSFGIGPIHCDQVSADKTYEFRLPAKRIVDGGSATVLGRLYGFTATGADAGNATILTADFAVADGFKEPFVRLTGAQIKALIPTAVKFRHYAVFSSTNGQIEFSDFRRSVVTDIGLAIGSAQSTALIPANGRFPWRDPSDTSGDSLRGIDFSVLQSLLGGASAGTIATLSAVLGTKTSRYAPPQIRNVVRPYIDGVPGNGQVQTLNVGKWSTAVDFNIIWLSNGVPIPGAADRLTYTRTTGANTVASPDTSTSVITAQLVPRTGLALASIIARTTEAMPTTIASIVAMGDSITAGQGAGGDEFRWLNKLAAYYGTTNFLNQGKSGTVLQNSPDADGGPKSNNGRDRYLADLLSANKRDLVIIAYGFNDARYVATPGEFNVLAYINDYREIVAGLIAGGYPRNRILIITPHYLQDAGLTTGSPGFAGVSRANFLAYVDASKQIALEFGTYWADSYTLLKSAFERGEAVITGDNIHPSALGNDYIYQAALGARKFADPDPPTSPAVLDYFVGEDGQTILRHAPELGMAWERQPGYVPTVDAQLVNGRLYNPANNAVYRNLADMRGADGFVEADLTFISNSAANVGVMGRCHAVLNTHYFANYNRGTGQFGLYKVVDGVGTTQLGQGYADPFLSGTRALRLSMVGSSISVQVDGVTRIGVTDTDIAGPGFCGIRFGTIGSKTGGIHLSRFQTGTTKTLVEDEFSGVNGASLSGYTAPIGGGYVNITNFTAASSPVFINGRIRSSSVTPTLMRNAAGPSTADYYVEGVFDYIGVRSDDIGVIGRASASAETFYFFRWKSGQWELWRDVNGSQARVGDVYVDAFDSGSRTIRLTMKGSLITCQVDGVTVISIQDGSIAGPGFGGFRIATSQTDTIGRHLTRLVVSGL